ncbi:MAG: GIY-YIG nuclease family protein, partial [Elainella sp.]
MSKDSSNYSTSGHQPSLFTAAELKGCYSVTPTANSPISPDALSQWKQRIWQFQQQIQRSPVQTGSAQTGPAQTSLFEVEPQPSEQIDPFSLPRQNTEFWRWQATDAGVAALYFVIDYDLPIL